MRGVYDRTLGKVVWTPIDGPEATPRGVAKWPMPCIALSVEPHLAAKYRSDAERAGIKGAEFDNNGRLTFTSPGARHRYVKFRQSIESDFVDRSSYGGKL